MRPPHTRCLADPRQNSSALNFATTPATIHRMLELLIVVVRAVALALRGHQEMVLENLALRQQLAALHRTTRCRLRTRDRLFWMALARSWRNWRTALIIVQPDTVIRWHRDWLRRRWTRRSQAHHGRPQIDPQIRTLVREMATANPLWGAPRIHGELRTLGVDVSERTVSRLLESRTRPPSQTWRTFLTNHLTSAASMDFFTVPTLTGRVLFVVIVLSHVRRRIVHFNITEHPTAEWTAQQVVDAFPDDTASKWLASRSQQRLQRDVPASRSGHGHRRSDLESLAESVRGTRDRLDPPRMPESCDGAQSGASATRPLDLQPVLPWKSDASGLEKDAPDPRPVSAPSTGAIIAIPEVGGLHHRYERKPRKQQTSRRACARPRWSESTRTARRLVSSVDQAFSAGSRHVQREPTVHKPERRSLSRIV
jgi:putative transposase